MIQFSLCQRKIDLDRHEEKHFNLEYMQQDHVRLC